MIDDLLKQFEKELGTVYSKATGRDSVAKYDMLLPRNAWMREWLRTHIQSMVKEAVGKKEKVFNATKNDGTLDFDEGIDRSTRNLFRASILQKLGIKV